LTAFFTLPYIAGLGEIVPEEFVESQWQAIAVITLAVISCSLFLLLLLAERPLYIWAIVITSCFVPFLLPSSLSALILRGYRFRSPFDLRVGSGGSLIDRGKIRFGIGEMLMATAALAILLSVGLSVLDLIPFGVAYAVVLVAAVLLSLDRTVARLTVGICTLAIVGLACGQSRFSPTGWASEHLFMAVLTFSCLRIYGYAVSRPSAEPASESSVLKE
jgi:hypothetical protein